MSKRSSVGGRPEGFSLIEVMIVVAIIGILANIAVPVYLGARLYAEASAVISDFTFFRTAVIEYYSNTGKWPADRGRGKEPPELVPYLEGKMTWKNPKFDYDWEYWIAKNGNPRFPNRGVRIGLSVKSSDKVLLWMLERLWSGGPVSTAGSRLTFVIEP